MGERWAERAGRGELKYTIWANGEPQVVCDGHKECTKAGEGRRIVGAERAGRGMSKNRISKLRALCRCLRAFKVLGQRWQEVGGQRGERAGRGKLRYQISRVRASEVVCEGGRGTAKSGAERAGRGKLKYRILICRAICEGTISRTRLGGRWLVAGGQWGERAARGEPKYLI